MTPDYFQTCPPMIGITCLFHDCLPTRFYFSFTGGHHQAKAGQGPQEDPGAQGQVSRRWKGEGQIQGGDH